MKKSKMILASAAIFCAAANMTACVYGPPQSVYGPPPDYGETSAESSESEESETDESEETDETEEG